MRSWWVAVGLMALPMIASAADIASPIDGGINAAVIISLHDAETAELQRAGFAGARATSLKQRAHARSGSKETQYAEALSTISATWTSADRGTIEFQLEGAIAAECCGNSVYTSSPSRAALDDWHYTFVAKSKGLFRLGYRLSGTGSGAGGFSLSVNGVASDLSLGIPSDGTTVTNSRDFPLLAGQTYTFAINNLAGFSTAESALTRFVSSASFTFEILSPAEDLLADLIQDVTELGLESELKRALAAIERSEAGTARTLLESFISSAEAQRGKALTDVQHDALIAAAQAIIDSL